MVNVTMQAATVAAIAGLAYPTGTLKPSAVIDKNKAPILLQKDTVSTHHCYKALHLCTDAQMHAHKKQA